jgi:NADH-quinone oxidoreductase subunit C
MGPADFHDLAPLRILVHDPGATGLRLSVFLAPERLVEAARRLDLAGWSIEDITLLDVAEGFQAVYHFCHWTRPGRIALRALVAHDLARLPSLAGVFPGAEWHEREAADLFGLIFDGIPNARPLLLDADQAGLAPLRKGAGHRKSLDAMLPAGTEA